MSKNGQLAVMLVPTVPVLLAAEQIMQALRNHDSAETAVYTLGFLAGYEEGVKKRLNEESPGDPHLPTFKGSLVYWRGCEVPLTSTERRILLAIVDRRPHVITFKEVRVVHSGRVDFHLGAKRSKYFGSEFAAERGFIKRIRQKMKAVDPGFACIASKAKDGYRWLSPPGD